MSKLDSRFLPDNVLDKMAKADRPKGKAGKTHAELSAKRELDLERQQHRIFSNYCLLKDITFDYHNPTRRTTNRPGWPDFVCLKNGRVLFIEFKSATGRLSLAQKEIQSELQSQGFSYHIVTAASQAVELAQTYLLEARVK